MQTEIQELIKRTDYLAKETFNSQENMKDFLFTLANMYYISYNNILLLKDQKQDISCIFHTKDLEKRKINLKEGEKPLKIIKRIKKENSFEFVQDDVYDISQTEITNRNRVKKYEEQYIEQILKGICSRRGIEFIPKDQMNNIIRIVGDISDNCRKENLSYGMYGIDAYARQITIEVEATSFAISKMLNLNISDYDLKEICKWGIDKDSKTLKESLKYMQQFTNYFAKDFVTQEKIYKIEKEAGRELEEFE